MLQRRGGGGFGGFPGGPAPFRAGAALLLLGGGALFLSESLFNGMLFLPLGLYEDF